VGTEAVTVVGHHQVGGKRRKKGRFKSHSTAESGEEKGGKGNARGLYKVGITEQFGSERLRQPSRNGPGGEKGTKTVWCGGLRGTESQPELPIEGVAGEA